MPGVQRVAVESGISKLFGDFSYAINYISSDFFSIKRYTLDQGRFAEIQNEIVVGAKLKDLLGSELPVNNGAEEKTYTVVGVLTSVNQRDLFADDAVYIVLNDSFMSFPSLMYIETTPQSFHHVGENLKLWLDRQGLLGYHHLRLADQYGLEIREKVARLLGGALGFGVLATLLVSAINLVTLYLSQILGRIRQLGIRRAVGASESIVIKEEIAGALPWAALGFIVSLPLIYLGHLWIKKSAGLSATPGIITFGLLAISLLLLITLTSFLPAYWAAKTVPAQAIRGFAHRLKSHRLWLAGLGLCLGISGLILQSSMSKAAVIETKRILGEFSPQVATVGSFDSEAGFSDPRSNTSMSPSDYQAFLDSPLAQKVSQSSYIRGFLVSELKGSQGTSFNTLMVYTGNYPQLMGITILQGRLPNPEALEIILGKTVAQVLFGDNALGQSLTLFGREWAITGIFEAGQMGIPGSASNTKVLIPSRFIRAKGDFNFMAIEVTPDQGVNQTLSEIATFFTARYTESEHLPFKAMQPKDLNQPDISQTLDSLSNVYKILAGALLFLGGAGLASQLLSSLSSRIQEVGLRRAVGASEKDIFKLFLYESMYLGCISIVGGILCGVLFSFMATSFQHTAFELSFPWIIA